MNPAALKENFYDLSHGATMIVNSYSANSPKFGYDTNPLKKNNVARYSWQVQLVVLMPGTVEALNDVVYCLVRTLRKA